MLAKVIIWFTAISYLVYGVLCLVNPQLPADYAGLTITSGDALAEVGAMYGGMQTGIGLFCLLGALRPVYSRSVLLFIVFAIGGLAVGRAVTLLMAEQAIGSYTYGAIGFEWVLFAIALVAALKQKAA